MKVKNINGTTGRKSPDNMSWLEYYMQKAGWTFEPLCCGCNCIEKSRVGAHVMKVDSRDKKWYIVPMCYDHNNQRGETLEIDDIELVPLP